MIRDLYLRLLLIPLLGILLPWVSGMVVYSRQSATALPFVFLYFILTSLFIWIGCRRIHLLLRLHYPPQQGLVRRVLTISMIGAVYGILIAGLSAIGWMQFSGSIVSQAQLIRFIGYSAITVILFTLIYEVLYLAREKEQDNRIVRQLGRERSEARIHALQNELDPHFLFNALNTLNHLIPINPEQAYLFNNKLAQVYKYFLINKDKELIPLEKELDFIDDYFYLLQLRYDKKLQLDIQLSSSSPADIKIPPCSLQILLENAIKHNAFSEEEPLQICITLNGQYIKVMNTMRPKPYIRESTRIGLNNLNSRYKLLLDKEIVIHPGKDSFTVKLPVIR